MEYRPSDFYKSRRKVRWPIMVLLCLMATLVLGVVIAFYALQQFIVYDQSGVRLEFSKDISTQAEAQEDNTANEVLYPVPDVSDMEITIVYTEPDYESFVLNVGENLEDERARLVLFEEAVNPECLNSIGAEAVNDGYNTLVLEMKTESGYLAWNSNAETAINYGTSGTAEYAEVIEALHSLGLKTAAKISVCADTLISERNWTMALLVSEREAYKDSEDVGWLDPYNHDLRDYIIDLMNELVEMGFDEIILENLCHPVTEEDLIYSVTIHDEPDPHAAVSLLAYRLAEAMQDKEVEISAVIDTSTIEADGISYTNGQDANVFWKIFDRLFCYTLTDEGVTWRARCIQYGGTPARFVPTCSYDVPDDIASYMMYIPTEE